MRVFFAGTPEIAVKSLSLIAEKHEVCGVLANPDRPAGRKGELKPCPVKEKALELSLEVFQPEVIDENFLEKVKSLKPDILVTFAYGKIFRRNFLSLFPVEALNIHPSLLPRHRGPSPIGAAILSGDKETGITIQRMALKMDSGDIIRQEKIPLDGTETLLSLSETVSEKSGPLILKVLSAIEAGSYEAFPQADDDATYCRLVKKEDGLIDWNEQAEIIERKFRAYYPWPGIFTYWKGKILLIKGCSVCSASGNIQNSKDITPGTVAGVDRKEGILVKTGDRYLAVTAVKPEAKKEMDFRSFLNGTKDFAGSVLPDKAT